MPNPQIMDFTGKQIYLSYDKLLHLACISKSLSGEWTTGPHLQFPFG